VDNRGKELVGKFHGRKPVGGHQKGLVIAAEYKTIEYTSRGQ
jgi:hypothetical protein